MKQRIILYKFLPVITIWVSLIIGLSDAKLASSLHRYASNDTVLHIWVYFKDKPQSDGSNVSISARAQTRRKRVGFPLRTDADKPVAPEYIDLVEKYGGKFRNVYKWENAASFSIHGNRLHRVAGLPFVKKIRPVSVYIKKIDQDGGALLGKRRNQWHSFYGKSFEQLQMVGVPNTHLYYDFKKKTPGEGIMVALFDSGFRLEHVCFSYLQVHKNIVATRDFIDNDTTVADPDSVRNDRNHPYFANDHHGGETLSLIAGYDPGYFTGTAWGAKFALARTENTGYIPDPPYEIEGRAEEDNWAAAVVWAESLGVDIISSSLGYRDDFSEGEDYTYEDMNGGTTIVSQAAQYALDRGMIVVNAIGNGGAGKPGTLGAPADVEGVVSVGAVKADSTIASFSSTGPTADGRKKPDLVALGTDIFIPDVNTWGEHAYGARGQGTSYSTPIIAGICALIMQSHPKLSPEGIRQKLYASCTLLPAQDSVDNVYGRGLPDALKATMQPDEAFIVVRDSTGKPWENIAVAGPDKTVHTFTNKDGVALLQMASTQLPYDITLRFPGGFEKELSITAGVVSKDIVVNYEMTLAVNKLFVYPTVLRLNRTSTTNVTFAFIPGKEAIDMASAKLDVSVRTLDGRLVWSKTAHLEHYRPVYLEWNPERHGKRIVPGLYYVIAKYGRKLFRKKILISG